MAVNFKEKSLTHDQWVTLKTSITQMEICVRSASLRQADLRFLNFCADTHVYLFGVPRPNLKGPGIVVMFKNLIRKYYEYDSIPVSYEVEIKFTEPIKEDAKEPEIKSESGRTVTDTRPTYGKAKNRRR